MASGAPICSVSLATSSKRKDKASGEYLEETQWHRVSFYDKLAEIAGQYLKKGSLVYIEGRLKYGEYTDKDGNKRYTTDIVAYEMQMLGGKSDGAQSEKPQRQAVPQIKLATKSETGFDYMDDDIPF